MLLPWIKIWLSFIAGILFADGHGEHAEVEEEKRDAYFRNNIADIIVPALRSEVKLCAGVYREEYGRGAVYFGYNAVAHESEYYKGGERKAEQQVDIGKERERIGHKELKLRHAGRLREHVFIYENDAAYARKGKKHGFVNEPRDY